MAISLIVLLFEFFNGIPKSFRKKWVFIIVNVPNNAVLWSIDNKVLPYEIGYKTAIKADPDLRTLSTDCWFKDLPLFFGKVVCLFNPKDISTFE